MYPLKWPTRHVNPTGEVLEDLPRYRVVRGANEMLGSTLRGIDSGKSQRRKNAGRKCSLFVACLGDKTLRVNGILSKPAGSYKCVSTHPRGSYAKAWAILPGGVPLSSVLTQTWDLKKPRH